MTKEEFHDDIAKITDDGLESMDSQLALLIDMLGVRGFDRSDLQQILMAVSDSIKQGRHLIANIGILRSAN